MKLKPIDVIIRTLCIVGFILIVIYGTAMGTFSLLGGLLLGLGAVMIGVLG